MSETVRRLSLHLADNHLGGRRRNKSSKRPTQHGAEQPTLLPAVVLPLGSPLREASPQVPLFPPVLEIWRCRRYRCAHGSWDRLCALPSRPHMCTLPTGSCKALWVKMHLAMYENSPCRGLEFALPSRLNGTGEGYAANAPRRLLSTPAILLTLRYIETANPQPRDLGGHMNTEEIR